MYVSDHHEIKFGKTGLERNLIVQKFMFQSCQLAMFKAAHYKHENVGEAAGFAIETWILHVNNL